MKKFIILLVCIITVSAVSAQDDARKNKKDKKGQKDAKVESSIHEIKSDAATPTAELTTEQVLVQELGEKRQEIKELNAKLNKVTDSLTNRIRTLETEKAEQKKYIDRLTAELTTKDAHITSLNTEKANVEATATKLDKKIFKQCLLYPLERRYSARFIDEAKECIASADIQNNPEYKSDYDTYIPMLDNYAKFNYQVIDVLNVQIRKRLDLLKWNVTPALTEKCIETLKGIEYYKYYAKKDVPPYQSITYLDDAIDEVIALLKEGGTLNKQRYQNIIDKLQPRNN